jgi:hypothetical protein
MVVAFPAKADPYLDTTNNHLTSHNSLNCDDANGWPVESSGVVVDAANTPLAGFCHSDSNMPDQTGSQLANPPYSRGMLGLSDTVVDAAKASYTRVYPSGSNMPNCHSKTKDQLANSPYCRNVLDLFDTQEFHLFACPLSGFHKFHQALCKCSVTCQRSAKSVVGRRYI